MEHSKISWTDHTFNPWEGCTKVSPGCAHCYAETRNARFGGGTAPNWGKGAPRRLTSAHNWNEPRRWNAAAQKDADRWEMAQHSRIATDKDPTEYHRPRVFCASLADWLDDEVPLEWLANLLGLIDETPFLDWLLLTKRPHLWADRIAEVAQSAFPDRLARRGAFLATNWFGGSEAPANVWIGATVEDQERANQRIPQLLRIPARVRFLSCEPLLGPVYIFEGSHVKSRYRGIVTGGRGIDWVICGGESGANARPMHPEWARSLRDQCAAAGIAFHFKQWGEWAPGECVNVTGTLKCASFAGQYWEYSTQTENQSQHCHADDAPELFRVGKKSAGRLLDGVEHNAFPQIVTT